MNKLVILSLFSCLLFCVGCVTTSISPQQRRAMQVKYFESSYNNVFRAFKSVLQDEGYIIKNQDMDGGLIVAHASRSSVGPAMAIMAALGDNENYVAGTTYEVSVNLEKIRKSYVESRVIIQQVSTYSQGGSYGDEVIKPELYRNIYSKVMVEVERRKAQKR